MGNTYIPYDDFVRKYPASFHNRIATERIPEFHSEHPNYNRSYEIFSDIINCEWTVRYQIDPKIGTRCHIIVAEKLAWRFLCLAFGLS